MDQQQIYNAYTVYQGDTPGFFLRTSALSWKLALDEYMTGPGRTLVKLYRSIDPSIFGKLSEQDCLIELSKEIFIIEHNHDDNIDYLHSYAECERRWKRYATGPCSVARSGEPIAVDPDLQSAYIPI